MTVIEMKSNFDLLNVNKRSCKDSDSNRNVYKDRQTDRQSNRQTDRQTDSQRGKTNIFPPFSQTQNLFHTYT